MIEQVEDGSIEASGESLNDLEYADVRVEGHEAATVNVKDDEVEVLVFDPNDPTDSVAEFRFDRPEVSDGDSLEPDSVQEAEARAEIEHERKLDERRERYFDRNGHF